MINRRTVLSGAVAAAIAPILPPINLSAASIPILAEWVSEFTVRAVRYEMRHNAFVQVVSVQDDSSIIEWLSLAGAYSVGDRVAMPFPYRRLTVS